MKSEEILSWEDWISLTNKTKLVRTFIEDGEKKYVVEPCDPCGRMTELEIREIEKGLNILDGKEND